jgi:hypothetical protein
LSALKGKISFQIERSSKILQNYDKIKKFVSKLKAIRKLKGLEGQGFVNPIFVFQFYEFPSIAIISANIKAIKIEK